MTKPPRLTAAQRKALHLASRKGGAQQGTGKGTIRVRVANALLEREWVTIIDGTVLITKAGRAKLNEPVPEDPPIFLAAAGSAKGDDNESERWDPTDHGYTTQAHRAIDNLEVMDPAKLHPDWKLRAEAHRKLSRRDLDAARLSGLTHPEERVRELQLMASQKGRDVAPELKRVDLTRKAHERAVRALERKVTDEAA